MDEKKLNEAIASLLKDKSVPAREALAEMIIEFIQPNHITTNFVGMLLNTRALKPGDMLFKKLRKGIEVRTLVPGSIHLASEVTLEERANFVLDGADVKVTFNEWELESGQIGSVDEIRREMYAKLSDFYQNKIYTILSTVWTAANTPSNFTNVGGPITATALENAIDEINQLFEILTSCGFEIHRIRNGPYYFHSRTVCLFIFIFYSILINIRLNLTTLPA